MTGTSPGAKSIFAKHGSFPSSPAIRDITLREQARRLMSYLTVKDLLRPDTGWDYLTRDEQDALVAELTKVLRDTEHEVRKAALAELADYERKALAHQCPKCRAQEGTQCWDMRRGYETRHVSHLHTERMQALAEAEEAA